MKTNKAGQDLIKKYESLQLKAYLCPAGVPTIGYGHTKGITKEMVTNGYTIDANIANEMFLEDLSFFENGIDRMIVSSITENQFSSMVSLAYNIGLGGSNTKRGFYSSKVREYTNNNEFTKAAESFLAHVYAGGKELKGLVLRREAEKELYLRR
jgi:lysozyme